MILQKFGHRHFQCQTTSAFKKVDQRGIGARWCSTKNLVGNAMPISDDKVACFDFLDVVFDLNIDVVGEAGLESFEEFVSDGEVVFGHEDAEDGKG